MTEALQLLRKHRNSGALVDANMLLVYAVGKFDRNCLVHFSHTKQYSGDYELIEYLIETFPVVYTTPNVLTEVSNLGGKLNSKGFYLVLQALVRVMKEEYCVSKNTVDSPIFTKLGLTDAGIMSVAEKDILVLTADWPLYLILRSKNVDVVNINHLRQLNFLGSLGTQTNS